MGLKLDQLLDIGCPFEEGYLKEDLTWKKDTPPIYELDFWEQYSRRRNLIPESGTLSAACIATHITHTSE